MPEYYDGTKLLSLKDINGNTPEIYICVGNRTAGKTTWFNRKGVNGFIKKHKKFMTIARFNYELDNCAEKFFKDINTIFFPGYSMFSIKRAKGIYHDLYLLAPGAEKSEHCGYAVALNNADQIKKMSHLFSDVGCMIFDESTAMLDPVGRREVLETIEKLNREEGITVISITHYMDEAARADRVIVLSDGKLLLDGTPGEVFTHSDTLRKAGLDLPQCTAVAQYLITKDLPVHGEINTPEQCAEAILNAWKKM